MKTIEVSARWHLEDWDFYLKINAPYSSIDLALEEFKRIILDQRFEAERLHAGQFISKAWYYTVPERSWTLYVLTHPAALEMFQVVDNENNIN